MVELHDADFLLMFRSSDVATKSPAGMSPLHSGRRNVSLPKFSLSVSTFCGVNVPTEVCQVDDEYRPIAACLTVTHSEARELYQLKEMSFREVVAVILSKIVNAFALNVQMLPYFRSHHPTWKRKAIE